MPPKLSKLSKKAAGSPDRLSGSIASPSHSTATKETTHDTLACQKTRTSNKRRAESIGEEKESAPVLKKAKQDDPGVDAGECDASARRNSNNARELDASVKKKIEDMRFILADHTVRSMGALMDAIAFTGPRPDALEGMIDVVISHFEQKALAGEDLAKDLAAFEKVDEQHWEGEYDSDPDGYDKDVRRRLSKAEEMVERMSKQYLKDIIKQLHFYGRGGTNAALAAEIVAVLTHKAQDGENLKREYRVVKGAYAMCYGCCGDESGLDSGGSSDAEGEDDNEYVW